MITHQTGWLIQALSQSSVTAMRKTYEHHVSFYRVFDEGGLCPRHGGKKTVDLQDLSNLRIWQHPPDILPIQNDILNTFLLMDIAAVHAAKALADLADKAEGKGWLIERFLLHNRFPRWS